MLSLFKYNKIQVYSVSSNYSLELSCIPLTNTLSFEELVGEVNDYDAILLNPQIRFRIFTNE